MPFSVSMIALSSQLVVAVANGVPVFDVTKYMQARLGRDGWTF